MRTFCVLTVLCVLSNSFANALYSSEDTELDDIQEPCCSHGQAQAMRAPSSAACAVPSLPDDVEPAQADACKGIVVACCEEYFLNKADCVIGMKLSAEKKCMSATTEFAQSCCDDCSFGRLSGETQGKEQCGPSTDDSSTLMQLRTFAYHQCCLEGAKDQETTTTEKEETTTQTERTTTEKKIETTTEKKVETTTEKKIESTTEKLVATTTEKKVEKQKCKPGSCDHICDDESGAVTCKCREGYKLDADKKSCKDINECRESLDDLCTNENEVCHNTEGSFKCVPIKKREVGSNCPPGFKMDTTLKVCNDINECQLPRPPCPKYLCENTIGAYKCGGKLGKPLDDGSVGKPVPPKPSQSPPGAEEPPKNDICPPGFRAGPDDECLDVDECEEHADDCQRLSQYCINTNGGFFCQDHVSKRCEPGFAVNIATGICEDIDECELGVEVCKRSQVCVNLAGAYNCKSKISTLPKLATKNCQEGTRIRPGGVACEDIDECREGTHLCDALQNCVNTFGGHECRCKGGYELDSSSGSCVDIDECALKLDNCAPGQYCLNVLGSYTCSRRPPAPAPRPPALPPRPTAPAPVRTTTPRPTPAVDPAFTPGEEYYYYDEEDDKVTTSTTAQRPTIPPPTEPTRRQPYPTYPRPRPTTTRRPSRPSTLPTTTSTTTETPTTEATTTEDPYEQPVYNTPESRPRPEPRPRPEYPRPENPEDNDVQPYDRPANRRPEYRPRPTEPTREPIRPYNPPRRNEPWYPTEVSVTKPTEDPLLLEKDKDKDGSYGLNTSDIPKNQWTNVVGKEKPEDPDFEITNLHCLQGYERDAYGNCVDIDECEQNRHVCSPLEMCVNREGGYTCDCTRGFQRDAHGYCVAIQWPPTTMRTTTIRSTTPRTTTQRTTTSTSTTTERTTTEVEVPTSPRWQYTPPSRPRRPVAHPTTCELGYTYDTRLGRCVDIDECARNDRLCAPNEDCVNQEGGYSCICGPRCRTTTERSPPPTYESSPSLPRDPYQPSSPDGETNIITVGAMYGQRGPRYLRPSYTRLPNTGAIVTSCQWGYKLTHDNMCIDVDECAKNMSQCGPQQHCENFYGGYSCQCPTGHKLYGKDGCEDINECLYGTPCPYNSKCINTVGSYRCECGEGFRNSPSNDKVCVDIDECSETPQVCHQSCSNAWGSYRCYCKRGYRLSSDNRTCEDVDECAEWESKRLRGRLCAGTCTNEPGSYRCSCPRGYRLSDDGKSCIDIDECETGEATCGAGDPGHVCQNTHGSYHCHHIECPPGYRLEAKHRCSRIQRSCPISDWGCLQQPSAYSYSFITFVANIYLADGGVDLFTMHGPAWHDSVVSFELSMIGVRARPGVRPADLRCFDMRPRDNVCVVSLLCSLGGPQVAELELRMSLQQRGQFAGSAVARLVIIVSEYEF